MCVNPVSVFLDILSQNYFKLSQIFFLKKKNSNNYISSKVVEKAAWTVAFEATSKKYQKIYISLKKR